MKDIAISFLSMCLGAGLGIFAMALVAAGRHGSPPDTPPNYANWGG